MPTKPETTDAEASFYVLPRYLRFARTLALVSGAAVGIAAGVAVISTGGCETVCSGTPCPGQSLPPFPRKDASTDVSVDAGLSTPAPDAGSDTGGGPRPAPLLPRSWVA